MKSRVLRAGLGFVLGMNLNAVEAPKELSWKSFQAVADYARQTQEEKLYQGVTWYSSVLEAQRVASAADKPVLLWLYFGDPRLNC